MDFNEIHAIIKKLVKSGAAEVSFETKDLKLTVKNHPIYPPVINTQPQVKYESHQPDPAQNQSQTIPKSNDDDITPEGYITVKSPMVGIFYRKPAPENPPYVNVGDIIKKGSVVCLIEAMKLFNEIESDVSGKIVKTMVDDGTPVEYDQPLFLIDPK
ncbi:acetyl-CoA carboxylase biotin carboxyl carrier protein [Bacteroidota bacterium]